MRAHNATEATFTVRAAAGYHPVLEGGLTVSSGTVSVEGIHFRKGGLHTYGSGRHGLLARLANCTFEQFEQDESTQRFCVVQGGTWNKGAGPIEIVNCFVPGPVELVLEPAQQLRVHNSVVGCLRLTGGPGDDHRVQLTRSVLWNPGLGWRLTQGVGQHEPSALQVGGKLAVAASDCLFASGANMTDGDRDISGWIGSRNVYCQGHRAWNSQPSDVLSFDAWKQKWKSDADSVQLDPLDYDPRQWQLLSISPGYRQEKAGFRKDCGADVDRILVAHSADDAGSTPPTEESQR
jgi:hypothetical protein